MAEQFDCEAAIARVREIYGPFEQHSETIQAGDSHYRASYTADCVYRPIAGFTESSEVRGVEGFVAWLRQFLAAWEGYGTHVVGVDCVGRQLIVEVRLQGRGRASGMELEGTVFQVLELREGKIALTEDHLTREGAEHAAREWAE